MPNASTQIPEIFDADNHYYEPIDLFERYIDPKYRDRTFRVVDAGDGFKEVVFEGRPFGFVGGAGQRMRIRPGTLRALCPMVNNSPNWWLGWPKA